MRQSHINLMKQMGNPHPALSQEVGEGPRGESWLLNCLIFATLICKNRQRCLHYKVKKF